jgi:hypothetical protein
MADASTSTMADQPVRPADKPATNPSRPDDERVAIPTRPAPSNEPPTKPGQVETDGEIEDRFEATDN